MLIIYFKSNVKDKTKYFVISKTNLFQHKCLYKIMKYHFYDNISNYFRSKYVHFQLQQKFSFPHHRKRIEST